MSLNPLLTHASPKQNLWVPYFSTAALNASTISTGNLTANEAVISSIVNEYLSTVQIDAEYINNSTINTLHVDLDGQILTASATELLLNGIPIATQSSLSTIGDWAIFPAISTLDMAGNNILNASTISCQTIVANGGIVAGNLQAGNGLFQNLVAINSLFVSSNTSTISSLAEFAELGAFSTISSGTAQISSLNVNSISSAVAEISSLTTSALTLSSINTDFISTNAMSVSSINGAEFTSTGITVQVAGVSSLVANSISSLGAEIKNALVSTIQFKPSFDLALNIDTKALAAGLLGGLTNVGVGIGTGLGIIGTGIIGAVLSRPSGNNSVNTNNYYQYNTTTQLQFSTLNAPTSTFTRFVSSAGAGNQVPGVEIIVSSVISANTLCVRSLSDPINLTDPSTFTSTIQAFGDWVPVPIEVPLSTLSTIQDWAVYPAISTINFSTGVSAVVAASPGGNIALTGTNIQLIGGYTDAKNLLLVSSISTATILGANDNLFGIGIQGLEIRTSPSGQVWISSPQTNIAGFINTSTVGCNRIQAREGWVSSLAVSSLNVTDSISTTNINAVNVSTNYVNALDMVSQTLSTAVILGAKADALPGPIPGLEIRAVGGAVYLNTSQTVASGLLTTSTLQADTVRADRAILSTATVSTLATSTLTIAGLSSIIFSTSGTAGAQSQPAGRLIVSGNDLDVGQQDIWAQQIRLGAGNPINAQSEIIFYDAAANQRGLQTALQDRTLRVVSTINANQGGYLLDTGINPPFFSTINNTSTALMAFFPSSINSTIGVSTLSYIPVSFQATSAFSGTLLYPNISSSAIAANIVASTTIQTNAAGSYIIAQANTSFQNQTNQYHDIYLNLAVDGVLSPSTFTSLPAGLNHYANGSIAYRAAVSSGTHTLVLYASADANAVAVGTQVDIWGTGNLAP